MFFISSPNITQLVIRHDYANIYTNYSGLFGEDNLYIQHKEKEIQVFPNSYYEDYINQIEMRWRGGGVVYYRKKVPVLQNRRYGIAGEYEVELLIIILQQSIEYNSRLPEEITSRFKYKNGLYGNFPNYRTKRIKLEREEVNLLSSYTEWCIEDEELKKEILEMYRKSGVN
jgi:hypothetical protein